jgi:putative ABC transport system permease protein
MKYLSLVAANLGRNKLRTTLTGGAIALAVLLVCILLTMPAGLDTFLDRFASNTRISVHNKAGIVYSMPYAYAHKVRQVPGVAAAAAFTWFGGAFEEAGRVTFPNFAVEPEFVGEVYPDYAIPPAQLADFRRYRDGAIVGRQTMQKYGWRLGDRVTLRSTVWGVDLDLRIVGEIPNDRSPLFWLNREYVDQATQARYKWSFGILNVIWVRVDDPDLVGPVMQRIDTMFRNSQAETASETEKSFFANFLGSLRGFVRIILIVTALVSLCIVFIAANTASMAVRERAAEIAILKAIGFGRLTLFTTLLAETMALSLVAGATGVGLALGLTGILRAFASWSPQLGPLGGFVVTPQVMSQGLLLSLAVGLLAGVVPALGAARRPVAQTLREVY